MAWFDTSEAMGALNAIGRDANNFIKRTIEEIEKDLARVEVNVGGPGLRFGRGRSASTAAGTSDGGSMGSESKGPVKKALACEGCFTKFYFMRPKRECLECRRPYCSQCLQKVPPVTGASGGGSWCSRERRQGICNKCLILLAQPPSRPALLGLRTRDLQAFLASRKVPTHGCLEKDDLVNLVVELSNHRVNDPHLNFPPSGHPVNDQFPQSANLDPRIRGDTLPSRSEGHEATPSVHSFGTRGEGHSSPPTSSENSQPSSPSHGPSQGSSLYPRLCTEDEATSIPEQPSLSRRSESGHLSSGSSRTQEERPPSSNPPSTSEDGDWVMVDVEEHVLPPYSASTPSAPPSSPPSSPSVQPSVSVAMPSIPQAPEAESVTPTSPTRTEEVVEPPPLGNVEMDPPTHMEDASATTSLQRSAPEVNVSAAFDLSEAEGSARASPTPATTPSEHSTSASVSQQSSPAKGAEPFLVHRDIASTILSSTESEDDLSTLSIKQLKELLTSSRVDYRGCCEKKELLERAQRLWREYKAASNENLSDNSMCKVCMDAAIDCVMLECGHMATCTPCGKRMSECPICRQYVVRIVRTFRA